MFNFLLKGSDNPPVDDPSRSISEAAQPSSSNVTPVTLSPDEIRRRRLARLDESLSASKPLKAAAISSPTVLKLAVEADDVTEGARSDVSNMGATFDAAFAVTMTESTSLFETVMKSTSEVKQSAEKLKKAASSSPTATASASVIAPHGTPSRKRDITVSSSSKTAVPGSVGKSDIHNLIATNLALENVFLVTYRKEAAHGSIKYIGANNGSDVITYINHTNVSEIVCTLLSADSVAGGAIGYLIGSYKRLIEKENAVADRVREDLVSCRSQVISFITSALGEPEMFGPNSHTAIADFYQFLCDDSSPSTSGLLRELSEELCNQETIGNIVSQLVALSYSSLGPSPSPSPSPQGQNARPRSVLDNFPPALVALQALTRGDKRMAREVALSPHFLLDPSLAVLGPAPRVHPMIAQMPGAAELHGIAGAALEHRTLLGRVLRVSPDPSTDPQMRELFKDTHRQPRNIAEGNITNLRARVNIAQSAASDIVMNLLKTGGPSKEAAVRWLVTSLLLNVEAEKDRPSQLLSSSSGFTENLSAVMLSICQPVMTDPSKLKKIEWRFLTATSPQNSSSPFLPGADIDIFPRDSTRLTPPGAFPAPAHHTEPTDPSTSTGEFNFITLSFFMCWKALHFGLVQQFVRYPNVSRSLSHYYAGLETGDAQAVGLMVMKLCMEVTILSQPLLREVVKFCETAACALLSAFKDRGTEASDIDERKAESWLLPQSEVTPSQQALLCSLPEHMIEDLMTMLLFVAKTEPSCLGTHCLSSALSLVIFFLRRPWAVQSPHLRAQLGQVLFHVFIPHRDRGRDEMYTGAALADGPHSSLLDTHHEAQAFLAPALLLLYGDVERTGFYEKLTNRRSIMVVLKHLWTLHTHRPAFRGIATMSTSSSSSAAAASSISATAIASSADETDAMTVSVSPPSEQIEMAEERERMREIVEVSESQLSFVEMEDSDRDGDDDEDQMAIAMSLSMSQPGSPAPLHAPAVSSAPLPPSSPSSSLPVRTSVEYDSTPDDNYFIRFANGLMNETNSLVSTTMDRLAEIKKTQVMMQGAEWGLVAQEERTRILERLEGHERDVKMSAGLCLETLNMLNYLTSDEAIRQPFLMDEILPRFASMLLNVLSKLAGPKGLEIKVDNMDSYNFQPRTMLTEVCQAMVHFAEFPSFWKAIAEDGFYEEGRPLKKALSTVSKLGLISSEEAATMQHLVEQVSALKGSLQNMDSLTADAPEEFLDAILYFLMKDPVRLPTSNIVVDRSTIAQHLLNDETDPYNRQPLTMKMIEPLPELKRRIEDWVKLKISENSATKEETEATSASGTSEK